MLLTVFSRNLLICSDMLGEIFFSPNTRDLLFFSHAPKLCDGFDKAGMLSRCFIGNEQIFSLHAKTCVRREISFGVALNEVLNEQTFLSANLRTSTRIDGSSSNGSPLFKLKNYSVLGIHRTPINHQPYLETSIFHFIRRYTYTETQGVTK